MTVRITTIGGPTAVVEIGGIRLLLDPTFDPPQSYDGTPFVKTTGPVIAAADIGAIDGALLSHHQHLDNLDNAGRELLGTVPLIITTPEGASELGETAVGLGPWEGRDLALPGGGVLRVTATPAHHGPDAIREFTGPVTGFILSGDQLPVIYVSGDNASLDVVREISRRVPDIAIAVLFLGGARVEGVGDGALLTLDGAGAVEAARVLKDAVIVPVHAEGWAHFSSDLADVGAQFDAAGLSTRLRVITPGVPVEIA